MKTIVQIMETSDTQPPVYSASSISVKVLIKWVLTQKECGRLEFSMLLCVSEYTARVDIGNPHHSLSQVSSGLLDHSDYNFH